MRTLTFIVICIEFTITGFIHFTVCGARAPGFEVEGRHYPYFAKRAPGSARLPAGPVRPWVELGVELITLKILCENI